MENNEVLVEISARHVHLSQADLETLFGKGYELTVKKRSLNRVSLLQTKKFALSAQRANFPQFRF